MAQPTQRLAAGINNPGWGLASSQSLAIGHSSPIIPGGSPIAPPQSTAAAPATVESTEPSDSQGVVPSPSHGKRLFNPRSQQVFCCQPPWQIPCIKTGSGNRSFPVHSPEDCLKLRRRPRTNTCPHRATEWATLSQMKSPASHEPDP